MPLNNKVHGSLGYSWDHSELKTDSTVNWPNASVKLATLKKKRFIGSLEIFSINQVACQGCNAM